jgi:hypothetical protein
MSKPSESDNNPLPIVREKSSVDMLSALEYQALAEVPSEVEWFANIDNPRTRRAYRLDINDFMSFVGIDRPEQFRTVTRAHVIA